MTPKEKAEELVSKFKDIKNAYYIDELAKERALIAVDEMILVLPFTDTNATLNEYAIHLQKYLEQVKQEIENL